MFEYRITKYNPGNRKAQDPYLLDEWTMYSQVGTELGGSILTMEEYLRVEKNYVDTAVDILTECDLLSVAIDGLENNKRHEANSRSLIREFVNIMAVQIDKATDRYGQTLNRSV